MTLKILDRGGMGGRCTVKLFRGSGNLNFLGGINHSSCFFWKPQTPETRHKTPDTKHQKAGSRQKTADSRQKAAGSKQHTPHNK